MLLTKKLMFEDIPYQPKLNEKIVDLSSHAGNWNYNGEVLKPKKKYVKGKYRVEVFAGYAYTSAWQGISYDVWVDKDFYIVGYVGGGTNTTNRRGMNPYSGEGKADSGWKRGPTGHYSESDGIFGGGGGSGWRSGYAFRGGGGNALGNGGGARDGKHDSWGAAGTAVGFFPNKTDDILDTSIWRFQCGGNASGGAYKTNYGAGGGAFGNGGTASGSGHGTVVGGGSGTGGTQIGNAPGYQDCRGGLAIFDSRNKVEGNALSGWVDPRKSLQQGEGLGWVGSPVSGANGWVRITYLGGSEINKNYGSFRVTIEGEQVSETEGPKYAELKQGYNQLAFNDISNVNTSNIYIPVVMKDTPVSLTITYKEGYVVSSTYPVSQANVTYDAKMYNVTITTEPGILADLPVTASPVLSLVGYETRNWDIIDSPVAMRQDDFNVPQGLEIAFEPNLKTIDGNKVSTARWGQPSFITKPQTTILAYECTYYLVEIDNGTLEEAEVVDPTGIELYAWSKDSGYLAGTYYTDTETPTAESKVYNDKGIEYDDIQITEVTEDYQAIAIISTAETPEIGDYWYRNSEDDTRTGTTTYNVETEDEGLLTETTTNEDEGLLP